MQPLSDRVHAHSKLLTSMEISMSYTCFSGTELLVHTIRGNLMPPSPHCSEQWAYSFGSWLLCPNLPNRIVVEQQKSHPVPDAPTPLGATPLELVTGADCERNLCAVWLILRTCWIPERTLNQPAADRAGVITSPSSHNGFIPVNVTCFPLASAGRHRVKESCSIVCPKARDPLLFFFPHKKILLKGNKLFHWVEATRWVTELTSSMKRLIWILSFL